MLLASHSPSNDSRVGVLAALACYGMWGVMPLYFNALRHVDALELLAQRIIWCALFLAVVLAVLGRWPDLLSKLRSNGVIPVYLATSMLLSINWLVYIYGVVHNRTVETSLGYFINPLLNVAFGMVLFAERLRPMQWLALALAACGVLTLIVLAGEFPWIALTLGFSFACYGVLRKTAPADALIGLSIETLLMLPIACLYVAYLAMTGGLQLGAIDRSTDGLLLTSGAITAVPLLFFGVAARNLRLSTLGFLQYIAPTAQFVIAIFVFREGMSTERWVAFFCIWIALGLYSLDAWQAYRRTQQVDGQEEAILEPEPSQTG